MNFRKKLKAYCPPLSIETRLEDQFHKRKFLAVFRVEGLLWESTF